MENQKEVLKIKKGQKMTDLKKCESLIYKLSKNTKADLDDIANVCNVGRSTAYDIYQRHMTDMLYEDVGDEGYHGSDYVAVGRVFEPTGEIIKDGFRRRYEDYIFYDYDVEDLLRGLEVKAIDKDGSMIYGKLYKHLIDGKDQWFFERAIPISTYEHVWSKKERDLLYSGKIVIVNDFWSYTKLRNYSGAASWDDKKKIIIVSKI